MDVSVGSTKEINGPVDLAARIHAGSHEAEDELFQRYRRGVSVIINNYLRNATDIEELVHETFIIAVKKIRRGEIREPEKLSGFVCGIAKKLAHVRFRKSQRETLTDIDEMGRAVDPERGPLEQLLLKEQAEIVRQVIGELRMDRDRQIITRFYLIDEDKESICASLGLTSAHFNRVIFRALARFKELYEERLRGQK